MQNSCLPDNCPVLSPVGGGQAEETESDRQREAGLTHRSTLPGADQSPFDGNLQSYLWNEQLLRQTKGPNRGKHK